jgi:ceramide glucosyltransferase
MQIVLILGSLGLAAVALQLLLFGCLWRQTRRPHPECRATPKVAVLRPMKGHDPGLFENLVALYEQDYEPFEIFIGVEDAADPALAVARKVARAYPERVTRIVVTGPSSGLNPKVRILRKLQDFVSAELILVSDSNVRPRKDYLKALVAEQTSQNSDLVHSLLLGDLGRGLGATL